MEHFNRAYAPVEKPNHAVNNSDGNFLRVAGLIGLIMASPFIAFMGFFLILFAMAFAGLFFGTLQFFAPWALIALMALGFAPAIRDRLTGRYRYEELENRIESLQAELIEARKQIFELEEGADFHRKLAESNKKIASADFPVNVNLSVTKANTYTQHL